MLFIIKPRHQSAFGIGEGIDTWILKDHNKQISSFYHIYNGTEISSTVVETLNLFAFAMLVSKF